MSSAIPLFLIYSTFSAISPFLLNFADFFTNTGCYWSSPWSRWSCWSNFYCLGNTPRRNISFILQKISQMILYIWWWILRARCFLLVCHMVNIILFLKIIPLRYFVSDLTLVACAKSIFLLDNLRQFCCSRYYIEYETDGIMMEKGI